jgi:Phosphotransferase enzyme family
MSVFLTKGGRLEVMPHGDTNHTVKSGAVVTKSYLGPDADRRCAREAAVLMALAGKLPVPPLIGMSGSAVSMGFMPGVHGQELVAAGLAQAVLRACGLMLHRIHAIDPRLVTNDVGAAAVLVHGDYGPNNVLLDRAAEQVTAILDWEWAHAASSPRQSPARGATGVPRKTASPRPCGPQFSSGRPWVVRL